VKPASPLFDPLTTLQDFWWGVPIVRPTPAFRHKMDIYRRRVTDKNWPARWPKLTVLMT
jgi:hypothetical protein